MSEKYLEISIYLVGKIGFLKAIILGNIHLLKYLKKILLYSRGKTAFGS